MKTRITLLRTSFLRSKTPNSLNFSTIALPYGTLPETISSWLLALVASIPGFIPSPRLTSFDADIARIQRSDWKKDETFFDRNAQGQVTALAVSPNGAYLASASLSTVYIWSTETRRIIAQSVPGRYTYLDANVILECLAVLQPLRNWRFLP